MTKLKGKPTAPCGTPDEHGWSCCGNPAACRRVTEKPDGNGAREALLAILNEAVADPFDAYDIEWVDWLLLSLAERGYVIKPLVEH